MYFSSNSQILASRSRVSSFIRRLCRGNYFATFLWDYLDTIHNKDVNSLEPNYWIPLHRSPLYNLLNADSRTEFIGHIIALIRMVAAGEANVGHLRCWNSGLANSANVYIKARSAV
jgi:hypothetical protein